MKERSKRRLKREDRTIWASLLSDLFPWLYINECIWKSVNFKGNLQLAAWFIILDSVY